MSSQGTNHAIEQIRPNPEKGTEIYEIFSKI
jgi:hypothetical protein